MSQYTLPTIDPDVNTGTQLSQWLNLWANAIETTQIGSTRPAGVAAGFMWIEDVSPTLWNLKLYTGAADVTIASLNPTTGQPIIGGLGTAAYATLQTAFNDATAGRVQVNGGFGLGGNALDVTNYDTVTVTGWYTNGSPSAVGAPTSATSYRVMHINLNADTAGQVATLAGNSFSRSKSGGIWGAWVTNWNSQNLVKQASATDAANGRVLLVSAFGLGGNAPAVSNMDTVTVTGFGAVTAGATGNPTAEAGISTTVIEGTATGIQTFVSLASQRSFVRTRVASVWGAWKESISGNTTPQFQNVVESFVNKGNVSGSVAINPLDGGDQLASMVGNTAFTFTTAGLATNTSVVVNLEVVGGFTPSFPAGVFWTGGAVPVYASRSMYTFNIRNNAGTIQISGFQSSTGAAPV